MFKKFGNLLQKVLVVLIFLFMVVTGYSIHKGHDYKNSVETPFIKISFESTYNTK